MKSGWPDARLLQGAREDQAAFTDDGFLRTGDKGEVDAEGNLKITGRVKDLFKTSKGKYVAPAPIEDRLVMNALVEACAVTGANLGQPLGISATPSPSPPPPEPGTTQIGLTPERGSAPTPGPPVSLLTRVKGPPAQRPASLPPTGDAGPLGCRRDWSG